MVKLLTLAITVLTAAQAQAACEAPAVNQATIDLIKSFEGWYPNICKFLKFFTILWLTY